MYVSDNTDFVTDYKINHFVDIATNTLDDPGFVYYFKGSSTKYVNESGSICSLSDGISTPRSHQPLTFEESLVAVNITEEVCMWFRLLPQ